MAELLTGKRTKLAQGYWTNQFALLSVTVSTLEQGSVKGFGSGPRCSKGITNLVQRPGCGLDVLTSNSRICSQP